MKLSFSDYINLKDYRANELVEKQILYNNGKRYGQIVFLAYFGGRTVEKVMEMKNAAK